MTLRNDVQSVTILYKDGTEIEYDGDAIRVNEVTTETPGPPDTPMRYLNVVIHLVPVDMGQEKSI